MRIQTSPMPTIIHWRSCLTYRLTRALRIWGAVAAIALLSPAMAQDGMPQTDLPRTILEAGMHRLDVQVALTPAQRQIGLMWRKEMPTHEGMLFVFERPEVQCFWMRNTLLPLTAAFIADNGEIVNLADMAPQNDKSHCSKKPVRFVLEMNQGWFGKRAIKPGFKLNGALFDTKP